ncbi:flagellar hook-basal body complex protein FliE [Desulfobulbus elongatus]|uniref:flagellar hook-basal body complex protein FliE n=1 Tax=Desulfobulbus elongatus TaxID=53332 RepID=UPI00048296D2|nr:flagellar hook-basal body complex protein FliE [Desulfobulbus elongatus]
MEAMNGIGPVPAPAASAASPVRQAETTFGDILDAMVANTGQQQRAADLAIQQVHGGGEKNLHEAMIAMEKADISIRFAVQVRNKAIEAYQEIMRMQV